MQIYKNLDIGTAKPSIETQKRIKYNLIDIVSPTEDFSVFDYVNLCKHEIERLSSINKIPLICGGTGFYIKSLLFSYNFSNTIKNEEIRDRLKNESEKFGKEYLYNKLKELDYVSAMALHENDVKRVIRALEIYYTTNKPKSEQAQSLKENYEYLLVGIHLDREILYNKINLRVDSMIKNGLIDEVKEVLKVCRKDALSMQAIGYKEIIKFLEGEWTLDFAIEKIKQNTRNYAKRQITYFKSLPNIVWFDAKDMNLSEEVSELYF